MDISDINFIIIVRSSKGTNAKKLIFGRKLGKQVCLITFLAHNTTWILIHQQPLIKVYSLVKSTIRLRTEIKSIKWLKVYSFVGMGMCISETETITEKRKKEKQEYLPAEESQNLWGKANKL